MELSIVKKITLLEQFEKKNCFCYTNSLLTETLAMRGMASRI